MSDLKFTKDHEWVRIEGDTVTVGISNYAQQQLGDIVYISLPDVGQTFKKGEVAAEIDSVKAAGEVYAPMDGEVTDINDDLDGAPNTINDDPEQGGWMFKIKIADKSAADALMDADSYQKYIDGQ